MYSSKHIYVMIDYKTRSIVFFCSIYRWLCF